MPRLRVGSTAPNFKAETTEGWIDFYDWAGNSWVMLFSHPGDFTPVCTTELADVSQRMPEFVRRGVQIIAISADTLKTHYEWIEDIVEIGSKKAPTCVEYPIIADEDRHVSVMYDMLDSEDSTNVDALGLPYTIRTVFIIDPKKTVRTMIQYPAAVGRDFDEVLRVVDALQTTDKHDVHTPASWKPGEDILIPAHISDEAANEKFPGYNTIFPYLRTASLDLKDVVNA